MRTLVCGGRFYNDALRVRAVLDNARLKDPAIVICEGGAAGADQLANDWATDSGVFCATYKADWRRYGRAAGAIRNRTMLEKFMPELVIAFPGGKGTTNMALLAARAGVPVLYVKDVERRA